MKNKGMNVTPVSKINTKKWSGFVAHIRNEAEFMKSVRENASEKRRKSNSCYSQLSKQTNKSIFVTSEKNTVSASLPKVDSVPRIQRRSVPNEENEQRGDMIYLDTHPQNLYNWPKRKSCASRILKPDKLSIYPDIGRKKDIDVVSGAKFDDNLLLTI